MEEREAYDDKLARILRGAAATIARKGFHQASIRDIAAETGVSLSGLYYYFRSKEELLFLIQDHCFGEILQRARRAMEKAASPEDSLRIFILTHLSFFADNMDEMKVLSHEAMVLGGEYEERVKGKKRAYTELVRDTLRRFKPTADETELKVATYSLFGMLNWIYTWYRPDGPVPVETLADYMSKLFLEGFMTPIPREGPRSGPPGDTPPGSLWEPV